jgi:hypothetical protein
MKVKYIESLTDLEKALIDIGFDKFEGKSRNIILKRLILIIVV